MCGIFGFINKKPNALADLKKMAKVQIHRGPDGEGYFHNDNIALGMRRLSIIDVEHGQQPFYNNDKSVIVVCNGEIYNYVELREELISDGIALSTHSDIEIIPYLYEKYNLDFIKKLNGMYAIALFDDNIKTLFLVRDRLGIKPLYYSFKKGEIYFSSELKSIFAVDGAKKDIDYNAISAYLDLMYIPSPLTPFTDIKKLESGSILIFNNGTSEIQKYWHLDVKKPEICDEKDALNEISELLKKSIKIQMRSDVPVGSLLSGGVDSSCVTAFANQFVEKNEKFATFHTEWSGSKEKTDESEYAREVSETYGTSHVSQEIYEKDLIELLPKLIWHLEEPFADGAFIPTYALSKLAAEKVKVVLSGAGGDELFGGYSHQKKGSLHKQILKYILFGLNESGSYYDKWQPAKQPIWNKLFLWYKRKAVKKNLDYRFSMGKKTDYSNAVMLSDIFHYLQDDILFMTDKMSMGASLECRVPLLDHRIVEMSLKLDSKLKIRNNEHKYILKKLMEDYVPKEILYRKKEGFGAPVQTWVNKYKIKYFDSILINGYLSKNKNCNMKLIEKLCSKDSLNLHESWDYWKLLILEIWFRIFIEEQSYDCIFEKDK